MDSMYVYIYIYDPVFFLIDTAQTFLFWFDEILLKLWTVKDRIF